MGIDSLSKTRSNLSKVGLNLRKWLYFALVGIRGQALGAYYARLLQEDRNGIPPDTTHKLLIQLLAHCKRSVPYYSKVIHRLGNSFYENPEEYLRDFPILTKDIIRSHFEDLKSYDLPKRKWFFNTSGGSTGEPVRFIQDREYAARSGAITLIFSKLVGKDLGELEVKLWGSARDIVSSTDGWRANFINRLTNTVFINSSLMTPGRMREFIYTLNTSKPKLILTYVETIYELAKFTEREGVKVLPQSAIMTTAGKLYPFMRDKIEGVFQCKVFDRYGSREVGDVACERLGLDGLWVAPWGNYLEIVDPEGNRVPDGTEGEILVTSLTNYALPLIRYKIGDRGVFSSNSHNQLKQYGQVLKEVIGRSMDFFKTQDGGLINPGYFMSQLYFREWITQYQIIQKSYENITYRIVKSYDPPQAELDEITGITKKAMGNGCEVTFEFLSKIRPSDSGKYRYLMSEVPST